MCFTITAWAQTVGIQHQIFEEDTSSSKLESFVCDVQTQDSLKKVIINDLLEFSFPSSILEIQGEEIKERVETFAKTRFDMSAPPKKVVLQQKGLNTSRDNNPYVRILIETLLDQNGSFLDANTSLAQLSQSDKRDILNHYKQSIEKSLHSAQINWNDIYLIEHNARLGVVLDYTRTSVSNNEPVRVNLYCFPNKDMEIDITFACRAANYEQWKNVFDQVLNSLTFLSE